MASDEQSLRDLEQLLNEFFHPSTSNDRKRGIEEILGKFSQQNDCWKHSLYYLTNTGNEYVMMYCLHVLEIVITKRWLGVKPEQKLEIRNALDSFLVNRNERVPSFIRNQLVKLIVLIGRMDWPHFHPNFFSNILHLVQTPDKVLIGLLLIRTASEELACPREDLSAARKAELHKLLNQQVPAMLNILNNLLENMLEKHRSMVTATPPPSPTQGRSAARNQSGNTSLSSSPMAGSVFKSLPNRGQLESLPPFDTAAHEICSLALSCLAHLFSWIPLSSNITSRLLTAIFHLGAFGCEANPSRGDELGILAMSCIIELLDKNCIPNDFEDFLLQMFQQTFYLLQRLTKDSTTTVSGNRLAELNEDYVKKFTEFLHLFVSIHLKRFESNQQFPMLDFLDFLYKYTFKQPSMDGYYSCLDIWNVFLDYLLAEIGKDTKASGANTVIVSKYQSALLPLAGEILQKMQFKYNQSQLDEMDDETLDDDKQTEWQYFLSQNIETIAKIAEVLPTESFMLLSPVQDYLAIYLNLGEYITTNNAGVRRFTITAENECRRLHCTLRDLSSMLQAVGRLAPHLCDSNFVDKFEEAKALIGKLVHTAAYGSMAKLYEVASAAGEGLVGDFIEAHAQVLGTVRAYVDWITQFYVMSRQTEKEREEGNALVQQLMETVLPLLRAQGVPQKIVMSASRLFYSICISIRPKELMQLQVLADFETAACQDGLKGMDKECQMLIWKGLSHYFLLPWHSIPTKEQEWERRERRHERFVHQLLSDFLYLGSNVENLSKNPSHQGHTSCIQRTLEILKELVIGISYLGVTDSKRICHKSIKPMIHVSLQLFPIYIHQSGITEHMLSFFLALFEGLRAQMGAEFTYQMIQSFFNMFTPEQLTATILQETSEGRKVIEKFLEILQLIVEEPGAQFRPLLPGILTISIKQIYPVIAQRPAPDIKPGLFRLLHSFMTKNWPHFYKKNILMTMKPDFVEEIQNPQDFMLIMEAYGQSFMQPDIAIFKQNLESLEALNSEKKLYHKMYFKEKMLSQFLTVLLQVLLTKSHDILQEEIGISVYNMAAEDFDGFYSNFLPNFLSECEGLDGNQKSLLLNSFKTDVRDVPSFTQSIQRFVNDFRYYRQCNESLALGAVTFT